MADINYTTTAQGSSLTGIKWAALAAGDTGQPYATERQGPLAGAVQFSGTFGGAVQLEGSIDGVTYFVLKDVAGSNIAASAAGLFEFSTACVFIRPNSTGAASAVTVTIALRG